MSLATLAFSKIAGTYPGIPGGGFPRPELPKEFPGPTPNPYAPPQDAPPAPPWEDGLPEPPPWGNPGAPESPILTPPGYEGPGATPLPYQPPGLGGGMTPSMPGQGPLPY